MNELEKLIDKYCKPRDHADMSLKNCTIDLEAIFIIHDEMRREFPKPFTFSDAKLKATKEGHEVSIRDLGYATEDIAQWFEKWLKNER